MCSSNPTPPPPPKPRPTTDPAAHVRATSRTLPVCRRRVGQAPCDRSHREVCAGDRPDPASGNAPAAAHIDHTSPDTAPTRPSFYTRRAIDPRERAARRPPGQRPFVMRTNALDESPRWFAHRTIGWLHPACTRSDRSAEGRDRGPARARRAAPHRPPAGHPIAFCASARWPCPPGFPIRATPRPSM